MSSSDRFGTSRLQRLLDERDIHACIASYCRAADRQDFEALRSVYHADAVDHHGFYDGDVDGFIRWFEDRHRDVTMSMHIVANCLIQFTGALTAVAETSCVTVQRVRNGNAATEQRESGTVVLCRYIDVFEARDDRIWKIAERTVVYESALTHSVSSNIDLPQAAAVQRHDTNDPGYRLWSAIIASPPSSSPTCRPTDPSV